MSEKELLEKIETNLEEETNIYSESTRDDTALLLQLVNKKNRALVFCASILSTMHPWDQMKQQEVIDMVMSAGEIK